MTTPTTPMTSEQIEKWVGWCNDMLAIKESQRQWYVEKDKMFARAFLALHAECERLKQQYKRGHIHATHGPCCTCQRCGKDYDSCRCALDDVAEENERLRQQVEELEKTVPALRKCYDYFQACAMAWSAHDGRLLSDDGRPYAEAEGLDNLADEAGLAVMQALAGLLNYNQGGHSENSKKPIE